MDEKELFDSAYLRESVEGDEEITAQVIGLFLSTIPEQLDELDTAMAESDAATLKSVAHSIKGTASTVGALLLHQTALDAETCIKNGDMDGAGAAVAKVREVYEKTAAVMTAHGFVPGD